MPLAALVKKGQSDEDKNKSFQELVKEAKERHFLDFNIGSDDVSERLGDVLPRRSIMMFKGEYGTGKSIMCQRMAIGLLENHHKVTYITTELTVKGFLDQMFSLNYHVTKYILKGQLQVFSLHQFLGGGKKVTNGLERLMKAQHIFQDEVIIIDTMSSLAPSEIDHRGVAQLLGFFKRIVATGPTVILAVENGEIEEEALLPFLTATEILLDLSLRQTPMGQILFLNIVRFYGAGKRLAPNFAFRVEPKVGIVPEITDMA